jgi:hypothetical protein
VIEWQLQNPPLRGEVASVGGRRGIAVHGGVLRVGVRSDAGIPLRRARARHLPFKGRI